MKHLVFSVYDTKSGVYGHPFYQLTFDQAHRTFTDMATREASLISQHPADFGLFHVGSWEDTTGVLTPLDAPVSHGLAQQFIAALARADSELQVGDPAKYFAARAAESEEEEK